MITLNKQDGSISIDNIPIGNTSSISALEKFKENYPLIRVIQNDKWETYKLSNVDNGSFTIFFYFFDNELKSLFISIGLKYESIQFLPDEQYKVLDSLMQRLGGESKYWWGKVLIEKDPKSGIAHLILKYG